MTLSLNPALVETESLDDPQPVSSRRPRWAAAIIGLGVLLGPLAHILIFAFIAVALLADGGDGDESASFNSERNELEPALRNRSQHAGH